MKPEWKTVFFSQMFYILITLLSFFYGRKVLDANLNVATSATVISILFLFIITSIILCIVIYCSFPGLPIKKAVEILLFLLASALVALITVGVVAMLETESYAQLLILSAVILTFAGVVIGIVAYSCELSRVKLTLSYLSEGVLIFIPMYFLG